MSALKGRKNTAWGKREARNPRRMAAYARNPRIMAAYARNPRIMAAYARSETST